LLQGFAKKIEFDLLAADDAFELGDALVPRRQRALRPSGRPRPAGGPQSPLAPGRNLGAPPIEKLAPDPHLPRQSAGVGTRLEPR
jgi:hypothetical protein